MLYRVTWLLVEMSSESKSGCRERGYGDTPALRIGGDTEIDDRVLGDRPISCYRKLLIEKSIMLAYSFISSRLRERGSWYTLVMLLNCLSPRSG